MLKQAECRGCREEAQVQGWLRASVGKREGTPLGLVSHFPPGAGLRASEWSLCAQQRLKGILVMHWDFQPSGVGWSGDALDVEGAASKRFQGLERWVSILPGWVGA